MSVVFKRGNEDEEITKTASRDTGFQEDTGRRVSLS